VEKDGHVKMIVKDMLDHNPNSSQNDIRTAITGNLCRSSGYRQIVYAIQTNNVPPQKGQ
jgi:aerobic-type carbon monoxide dehydrogenase small subunit (CoxS/CutS family)